MTDHYLNKAYSKATDVPAPAPHTIFGVRHHGPGSARSLGAALDNLRPDCILVEGPSDATDLLSWLAHPDLEPPVALIVYRPDQPKKATFFPFSVFSPEYQALRYGLGQGIPVRLMDLPQAYQLGLAERPTLPELDPLRWVAEAAGYASYDAWWTQLVEQRQDSAALFPGILELMATLRREADDLPPTTEIERQALEFTNLREAYMRQSIREAIEAGYSRIAVVCGAWHAPALVELGRAGLDAARLADLPLVEVEAAWVPWTYSRLSLYSGYGAGIASPGWYHHLWQQGRTTPRESSTHWLAQVSRLLREQGFDTSAAHIIEAVRLAESLAALRNLPFPGLAELNEATQTVMCFGDAVPLRLIQEKLIISERMGAVPPDTPMVPLQRDLYQAQKRLRLRPEPKQSSLNLDLRKELHLARSHLLHRLLLLDVPWGKLLPLRGQKGTYQEVWRLQWQPDFAVRVIEANIYGNTIREAAVKCVEESAGQASNLAELTRLLDQVILADLAEIIEPLMQRIQDEVALSSDIPHLMDALPPLARVIRYGNVRQTDRRMVGHAVDGLLTRICIGLPSTCASMNDQAATEMFDRITATHSVVSTLQNDDYVQQWQAVLAKLVDQRDLHNLLAGRACRLLLDAGAFSRAEVVTRLERALIVSALVGKENKPLAQAAFWLEGFLKGGGLLLLHDHTLWSLIDDWVSRLAPEQFINVLPLLRRTFTTFGQAIRQQMHERIRAVEPESPRRGIVSGEFDHAQAEAVLPLVAQLLGINENKQVEDK